MRLSDRALSSSVASFPCDIWKNQWNALWNTEPHPFLHRILIIFNTLIIRYLPTLYALAAA